MRIAVGSDERTELTDALTSELESLGHDVLRFGALREDTDEADWPLVSGAVAEAVAAGKADEGVVCCWTGTGASIAANKVRGIRAALVHDAETARGARIWNHANVLALSLRATPVPIMKEILSSWFSTSTNDGEAQSEWNQLQIARIAELEARPKQSSRE